jgi:sec-independent protein translocase protein TatC
VNDLQQPFSYHFRELKRRVIRIVLFFVVTTAAAFVFHRQILRWLLEPAEDLNKFTGGQAIFTDLTEFWGTVARVSILVGIAATTPFMLFQIVRFVSPGLKSNERKWLWILMPASVISFGLGVAFGYYVLLPPAINFLLNFGGDIATPLIRISSYVELVTRLLFWLGLIFELPIVIFFLAKIGVVTPKWLASKRKWVVVLAFVAGAMITPTFDPVNQSLVAGPIIVMYEIGYWLARIGARRVSRSEVEPEAGD